MKLAIHDTPKDIARDAAQILLRTDSVLLSPDEPFTLTSGRKSPVYVDCRRLISFPEERRRLMDYGAQILKDHIGQDQIDVLAGGETAGIPYAAFLAERLDKPMVYVRKKPKGFGRMAQIEGHLEQTSPKTVLIEDLQTDGGSKDVFIKALREAGASIEHAFVIFHYGIFEKSIENMEALGLTLHSLTDWWHVLDVAKEQEILSPDSTKDVENFLNAPEKWVPGNSGEKVRP